MAAEPRPDELSDEELWNEFHRVVNMTSQELRDWLMTRSAGEDGALEPGTHVGTPTGEEVLHILGKRRTDLTTDDEDAPVGGVRAGIVVVPARHPLGRPLRELLLPEPLPVDALGVAVHVHR